MAPAFSPIQRGCLADWILSYLRLPQELLITKIMNQSQLPDGDQQRFGADGSSQRSVFLSFLLELQGCVNLSLDLFALISFPSSISDLRLKNGVYKVLPAPSISISPLLNSFVDSYEDYSNSRTSKLTRFCFSVWTVWLLSVCHSCRFWTMMFCVLLLFHLLGNLSFSSHCFCLLLELLPHQRTILLS